MLSASMIFKNLTAIFVMLSAFIASLVRLGYKEWHWRIEQRSLNNTKINDHSIMRTKSGNRSPDVKFMSINILRQDMNIELKLPS
jgi:hypothetical protein